MKTQPLKLDINKAVTICLRAGIQVYPEVNGHGFKVCINDNGKVTRYSKVVPPREINTALTKTYKHEAIKLLKVNNDA